MSEDIYKSNVNGNEIHAGDKSKGALFWFIIGFGTFFFLSVFCFVLLMGGLFAVAKTVIPNEVSVEKAGLTEINVSGSGDNKIVLVPIKGIISDKSAENVFMDTQSVVESVKQSLGQAAEDDDIKAVILVVDSPGGGITASDKIYNNIMLFKEKTGKKVVVCMQDLAASGGYYVAVAADRIIAHPTTITGSIGVIMPIINMADLANKYGIKDDSVKSGEMKDIGSPLKQMMPGEKEVLHNIVMEMYMRFVTLIAEGRKMPVDKVKMLADGRIYTGSQALENGLIDQIGYLDDAISAAKEMAGIDEASIIKYQKKFSVGSLFKVMASKLSTTPEITLKLDEFPIKSITKPMYLWTGR